jgi:mycothiol synthase
VQYGDTTLDMAHNTVESIRQEEAEAVADRWIVLLLHGSETAGVTVVEVNSAVPTVAEQLHTVVLPAHRGKGLGRPIKARMPREPLAGLRGHLHVHGRTSENR